LKGAGDFGGFLAVAINDYSSAGLSTGYCSQSDDRFGGLHDFTEEPTRRAQGVHAAHRQAVGGVWLVEAVLALVVWEERLISRRTNPNAR
jgi:hypothetical protein